MFRALSDEGLDTKPKKGPLKRTETNMSIMQGVQSRINELTEDSEELGLSVAKASTSFKGLIWNSDGEGKKPKKKFSFRSFLIGILSSIIVVFGVGMGVLFEAFFLELQATLAEAEQALSQDAYGKLEQRIYKSALVLRISGGAFTLLMLCATMITSFVLGGLVMRPVRCISEIMSHLSEMDFQGEGGAFLEQLKRGRASKIEDIASIHNAFCRLLQGVEMFARYVPETVVRSIIRGEARSRRLHVSRREVSIMFSDIKDFTNISEKLSQEDLLFVLTRYLSIMTRIVEAYEGVVAEILGDGLLVFWNSPDTVLEHATKACSAALAQQQALTTLNAEFAQFSLPKISIRIGLHTGTVLSGNIGSESKMKFGCMGDPVNLASRLEGLCKMYGVGILCSAALHDQLSPDARIFCRQLDLVQVKGKKEPTRIYEVVGMLDDTATYSSQGSMRRTNTSMSAISNVMEISDVAAKAMGDSANALRTFEGLNWNPIGRSGSGRPDALGASESGRSVMSSLGPKTVGHKVYKQMKKYEEALFAYQAGRFTDASSLVKKLLEELPDDDASKVLLEKVEDRAQQNIDLSSWKGVTVMSAIFHFCSSPHIHLHFLSFRRNRFQIRSSCRG